MTRIGVSLEQYLAAPKISPILREIQGGKSKALKAMRFAETPLIQTFFSFYDKITPRDRDKLSLEAVALAAKVDIIHLWGEIQFAMREHSVNAVKVIAVGNHPEVMKKTVEYALTPGGHLDRKHVHEMLGALSSPKTTFINKFFAGGQKDDKDGGDPEPEELIDDVEDFAFPSVSVMQERVQTMRQKLLPGK